ncbi:ArsR/SmtB family transcription factor [Pseudactinotalea suaedae]|uniref:ArsR/SmtB family transcription factor n=1 Tax=Pseudactinotalea suaedae TaxID=1524924 RepID=UPI0012E30DFB|nr:metalloregulator ArsR/SmtB family transcription factor [Pseudactinotalea suaedae]
MTTPVDLEDLAEITDMCGALSDQTRWEILRLIGVEALSASELAQRLPITRQAIARHLGVLAEAGLVETEHAGRQLRYRALGGRLSELARHLETIGRGWDRRLERIRSIAEEQASRD